MAWLVTALLVTLVSSEPADFCAQTGDGHPGYRQVCETFACAAERLEVHVWECVSLANTDVM